MTSDATLPSRYNVDKVREAARIIFIWLVVWVIAASLETRAASTSQSATGTATVSNLAKLAISPSSLSFPDSNPDAVPSIPSSGGALTINAKGLTSPGSTITLTVMASDDFISGSNVIAIGALTWTGAGAGLVSGTMNKTTAQSVGSWVDSGNRTGSQTYALANSWSYATGTYSTTLTYTLTAP